MKTLCFTRVLMTGLITAMALALALICDSTSGTAIAQKSRPNPLLEKWKGPFGGVPPFDKIKVADFRPALESAMSENLAEIDVIAENRDIPTFENTIVRLEQSGSTLTRVARIFSIYASSLNTSNFGPVQAEIQPKLAAHSDTIYQNQKLFKRIAAVYDVEGKKMPVSVERFRLVKVYYDNFVHAGAMIDGASKIRLSEINQKLAGLYQKFNENLQGEERELNVLVDKESDLAGLPYHLKEMAAADARYSGKTGWMIRNTRRSVEPLLTYADNRGLRERVWKMFVSRGDNAGPRNNNATIVEILKLRSERANLFGQPSHAHWVLQTRMAGKPEVAMALLEGLWPASTAGVRADVANIQARLDREKLGIKVEPWDYRYYMEKIRRDNYNLDQGEIGPYLQLDKIREAMFWVAGELFDLSFTPLTGVPVIHPDQTVFEVKKKSTGKHVGLWYFDPYARDGKDAGAWMNQYRDQSRIGGNDITAIVSNNANFVKGKPGAPVLLTWDDAITMFHEFGHAVHGLSSNVTYPYLSGTAVATDYVEFPAQVFEYWLSTPEVLDKFALHYETGKPMPKELVARLLKASTFKSAFDTTELLASAMVDMKIHMADPTTDPDRFEKQTLEALKMPSELVMRHRTPQFRHIFGSDDYSAGYYSYLWSDILTADALTAFTEAGGPYDKKVAAKLVKYVFSVGNTIDPAEGYRQFRGHDPNVDALMIKRGFPVKK